jgi:hypothetical protein
MVQTKMLADGVMEIRLVGDDGELEAIVELTKPTHHARLVAHLLDFQAEVVAAETSPLPGGGRLIPFPSVRIQQVSA